MRRTPNLKISRMELAPGQVIDLAPSDAERPPSRDYGPPPRKYFLWARVPDGEWRRTNTTSIRRALNMLLKADTAEQGIEILMGG
jgi:hypothetical protein